MSIQESAAELNNIAEAMDEPIGIVQNLITTLEGFQLRAEAALGDDTASHWRPVMEAYQQAAEARGSLSTGLHHFSEALKAAAQHHRGG